MKYQMVGVVERIVTDIVTLTVEADTEEQAYEKSRAVLISFPNPHGEDGVPFCYVDKRKYHEPTEIIDIYMQEDHGIA